jgi:pimeloyl-ACP methyl ester carboxylesterase
LVVAFHGFGGDHTNALASFSMSQALALHVGGIPVPPMAMVAADGGGGYWHAHPHDDPLGMVINELVPLCRSKGLGVGAQKVGAIGVSMGGYGALNLAEHEPTVITAVAAVSPAVWTSFTEAQGANAGAFGSAAEFSAKDIIRHVRSLDGVPVRIASGRNDPFHPGVEALVSVLPPGAEIDVRQGCHDGGFFRSAEPAAVAFLGRHLTA